MNTNIVGTIRLGTNVIDVYSSLGEPLFKASDLGDLIEYSRNNTWKLLELCEEDEKFTLPIVVAGQSRTVSFVTEHGLYNILSQSRKPVARAWRKVIHDELINLRRSRGKDIVEQVKDWNDEMDSVYFDDETGIMMRSVTVQGGDVIQVPCDK